MSAGDMPDELEDLDESASEDLRKAYDTYQNFQNTDTSVEAALPALIEGLLWTLTIVALGIFIGGMFVTGPDKLLSGTEWLVIGCGGIGVFGISAYVFRVLKP